VSSSLAHGQRDATQCISHSVSVAHYIFPLQSLTVVKKWDPAQRQPERLSTCFCSLSLL